jgi:uncharacterized membrane protein
MNSENEHRAEKPLWVDRLVGGLLLAVLAAVGWMVFAAFYPDSLRLGHLETEVVLMLMLLTLALLGISAVALIHTREK